MSQFLIVVLLNAILHSRHLLRREILRLDLLIEEQFILRRLRQAQGHILHRLSLVPVRSLGTRRLGRELLLLAAVGPHVFVVASPHV